MWKRDQAATFSLPRFARSPVYQLWFAGAAERPVTGGAFFVNARGEAVVAVSVPMPIAKARAVAVTEEPAPMSPAATGAHLLDLRAR